MDRTYPWPTLLLATVVIIGSLVWILRPHRSTGSDDLAALRDSVAVLSQEVHAAAALQPGLGEYMTAMQLHTAKLWFAAKAENWRLADYEVNELSEAIDGAIATNTVRDSIKVSVVLQAMRPIIIDSLALSVKAMDLHAFQLAYSASIATCNKCHTAVGYPFMRIIEPSGPPVMNQAWKVVDTTNRSPATASPAR